MRTADKPTTTALKAHACKTNSMANANFMAAATNYMFLQHDKETLMQPQTTGRSQARICTRLGWQAQKKKKRNVEIALVTQNTQKKDAHSASHETYNEQAD